MFSGNEDQAIKVRPWRYWKIFSGDDEDTI